MQPHIVSQTIASLMQNERYCIIMAGGIGSRFWPLSKADCPKQFIDILGTGKSFIRATFERFRHLVPAENFLVLTNVNYKALVLQHLPELQSDQVLCEPCRRNTAPCLALANFRILIRCQFVFFVVTAADHLVSIEVECVSSIAAGFEFLETDKGGDALLSVGIKPSRPETGYGYIQADNSRPLQLRQVTPMLNFKEKPDLATAKQYLQDGSYFWNAGIFLWTLQGIQKAFHAYLPDMVQLFDEGKALFGTAEEQRFIDTQFPKCRNISIDYGVMEHASQRYLIPADFGWSDIGTWGSLFAHAAKDEHDNAVQGKAVVVQTEHSIVNVEEGVEAIVQGLDNCLVAYRDRSLLVCRLDDEQKIKDWVEKL